MTKIINEKLVYGEINFDKVDIQNEPVEGAQFALYTDKECFTPVSFTPSIATSDANGKVTFTDSGNSGAVSGIPVGNYYMKETDAPGEFVLNNQVYFVHVAGNDTADTSFIIAPADDENPLETAAYADLIAYYRWKAVSSVENERVKATIKKVDENGRALLGAKFTLTRVSKDGTHDAITGEGAYSKTVPDGTGRTDLFRSISTGLMRTSAP